MFPCPCSRRLEQTVVLVVVLPHKHRRGGRSFPARPVDCPIHFTSLRGSHRPIHAQECAPTLVRSTAKAVDRSRVRIDATAEVRGDAPAFRAAALCRVFAPGAVEDGSGSEEGKEKTGKRELICGFGETVVGAMEDLLAECTKFRNSVGDEEDVEWDM